MIVNGRLVDVNSIVLGDVNHWDAPDYSDAYVESADYVNGQPLDDNALDLLLNEYPQIVYELIRDGYVSSYEYN